MVEVGKGRGTSDGVLTPCKHLKNVSSSPEVLSRPPGDCFVLISETFICPVPFKMYSTSIYLAPSVYRTYAACWEHVVTQVEVTAYRERQTVSSNWNKIMAGGVGVGTRALKEGKGNREGRGGPGRPLLGAGRLSRCLSEVRCGGTSLLYGALTPHQPCACFLSISLTIT